MIHVIFDNHIAAPGGRYAGGNPVQQIFLHPQPGPLRHSCGEILVSVIIFDYICNHANKMMRCLITLFGHQSPHFNS